MTQKQGRCTTPASTSNLIGRFYPPIRDRGATWASVDRQHKGNSLQ